MRKKISILLLPLLLISSCNDDFLEKGPLTEISPDSFFKNGDDLRLYVNQFYTQLPTHRSVGRYGAGIFMLDKNSDNALLEERTNSAYFRTAKSRLTGQLRIPQGGTTDADKGDYVWSDVRKVNYFFSRLKELANSEKAEVKQYIGEAYFFRAWIYFNLMRRFGDLPWIDKPLEPDIKELAIPRISRRTIAQNIVADLDKAISLMGDGKVGEYERVNKYVALAFKARVCLYEGTWEKYHNGTIFGVEGQDGTDFITQARDAAKLIIDSGRYELFKGSADAEYFELFNKLDYTDNKEVLFWGKHDADLLLGHNLARSLPSQGAQLTKSLIDDYLMKNGKAINESGSGYHGEVGLYAPYTTGNNRFMRRLNLMKDRDPRLEQTVLSMGEFIRKTLDNIPGRLQGNFNIFLENYTGFPCKKGMDPNSDEVRNSDECTIGSIIFRYAEVLLIHAEASAELGEDAAAKADIDLLRNRVGMTTLTAHMPARSTVLKEVRRERRIELVCEGFRLDDLLRWREAHKLNGKHPQGVKWEGNSDLQHRYSGRFNVVININGETNIARKPETEIMSDAQGYVSPYKALLPGGYLFLEKRDYLLPETFALK